jgi:hypothetical protein
MNYRNLNCPACDRPKKLTRPLCKQCASALWLADRATFYRLSQVARHQAVTRGWSIDNSLVSICKSLIDKFLQQNPTFLAHPDDKRWFVNRWRSPQEYQILLSAQRIQLPAPQQLIPIQESHRNAT